MHTRTNTAQHILHHSKCTAYTRPRTPTLPHTRTRTCTPTCAQVRRRRGVRAGACRQRAARRLHARARAVHAHRGQGHQHQCEYGARVPGVGLRVLAKPGEWGPLWPWPQSSAPLPARLPGRSFPRPTVPPCPPHISHTLTHCLRVHRATASLDQPCRPPLPCPPSHPHTLTLTCN
jgi:hypothetical protein